MNKNVARFILQCQVLTNGPGQRRVAVGLGQLHLAPEIRDNNTSPFQRQISDDASFKTNCVQEGKANISACCPIAGITYEGKCINAKCKCSMSCQWVAHLILPMTVPSRGEKPLKGW
jgi:hypothetical protein